MENKESWVLPGPVPGSHPFSSPVPSLLLLVPFAGSDCHAYKLARSVAAAAASGRGAKGAFSKEGSLVHESPQPGPVATFPSEVKTSLSLVGELELLFYLCQQFLGPAK